MESKPFQRLISLTTDFGLDDEYVGVMKGVLLGRFPAARIVDLSHRIAPQDVCQAAYLLWSAYRYFPEGTLHVVVVDPGVGTDRRIVLVEAAQQLFLAPDNGILTLILTAFPEATAFEVAAQRLFLHPVSHTFHGRDIFAPVAARLAAGLAPAEVGPLLDPASLERLELPSIHVDPSRQCLQGTIIGVDGFGNLLTNIQRADRLRLGGADEACRISVKGQVINGLAVSYGGKQPGELLALFGSREYLEIAINQGSAASRLGAGPRDEVTLSIVPAQSPERQA